MDEEIKQRLLKLFDSGAETIADLKVVAPEVWQHLVEEFARAHYIHAWGSGILGIFLLAVAGMLAILAYRVRNKDGDWMLGSVLASAAALAISFIIFGTDAILHLVKAVAPSYHLLREFM